ncbi:toxin-antitoxin system, toxin component [Streptomyces sp. NPDC059918]|uniref:toxin-antitoxin system, toxin component n=1 Tax=unclassified Streptomyces TaxID=2593676 RepID=UPI00364CBB08
MAELYAELEAGLDDPVPSDVDRLFRRPAAYLTQRRGRPVRIVRRDFPAGVGPVSGLWVDRQNDDVIAVVKSTSDFHSLVILGHEIWHMLQGHCGEHALDDRVARVATRFVSGDMADAELEAAVRHVAARSHAVSDEEAEAERFGRLMGRRLRRHVEHDPEQRVLEGTPARIQASLGAADD